MDKGEYPQESTSTEGNTWKTISVRGIGFAPVKQEVLVEPPKPTEPDASK